MQPNIYKTLGPALLATYLGVSPQRASVMIANQDAGDNRKRLRAALRALWERIGDELNG